MRYTKSGECPEVTWERKGKVHLERKGEKKRQHYVPRFVLRNFSGDDVNVGIVVLAAGKVVPEGPIKTQAYEDYFYGADQVLENSFSDGEADISQRLGDLSEERLRALSDQDIGQFRFFVHYQLFRTKAAVEQANGMATALADLVVDGVEGAPEASSLVYEEGGASLFWMATRMVPATCDLDVRVLTTAHPAKFVISDHPVVLYNQFAEQHPLLKSRGRATGLNARGLQIFMPISPSVCLLLFDPSCYAVDGTRICQVGPKDVLAINKMQTVNAHKVLFFDGRHTDTSTLNDLVICRAAHGTVNETKAVLLGKLEGEDGDLLKLTTAEVRVGAHLSFLRVTDTHHYRDHTTMDFPQRNLQLREFLKVHEEVLREEMEKAGRSKTGR